MKKYNRVLLFIILLVFTLSIPTDAMTEQKTIMLVLDNLDFERVEAIVENYYGLGFLNIKARRPSSEEGLYMSINAGRKLRVSEELYRGLEEDGDRLYIRDYDRFYKDTRKTNENIGLNLLGDRLRTSFIGDDSVSLVVADKNGMIDYGRNHIEYDLDWLKENSKKALEKTDFLAISYKIEDQKMREDILKDYINEFRNFNIMIIPRNLSKNIGYIFNKNLTPIVYLKNGDMGVLESKSTRRKGFVTIEDLSHEILREKGIDEKAIGNEINIVEDRSPLDEGKTIFRLAFNLLLIAGLFQGLTYLNQFLSSYFILRGGSFKAIDMFNKFIFTNMLVAIVMGIFNIHQYLLVYLLINIGLSYYISKKLELEDFMGFISSIIYVFLVIFMLFRPNFIYNSFFGYNNLFYGARYYGFNNGAMGIFLASSILSYFFVKEQTDNTIIKQLLVFIYFGLNMLVLSAGSGANTGGFITSVVLFLGMVWLNLLEDRSNFTRLLILMLLGLGIFAVNMYFDSRSIEKSHAIVFLMRIKEDGLSELVNMITIKLKELIKYTIMPPFSIIMVMQVLAIRKLYMGADLELKKVSNIMLLTSIVAFIINDTGMIAFIFINQFNIGNMLSKCRKEPV